MDVRVLVAVIFILVPGASETLADGPAADSGQGANQLSVLDTGKGNVIEIGQTPHATEHGNSMSVVVMGDDNTSPASPAPAAALGLPAGADLLQLGQDDVMGLGINGSHNQFLLAQDGNRNALTTQITGQYNEISVVQVGDHNAVSVVQQGNRNSVAILQR